MSRIGAKALVNEYGSDNDLGRDVQQIAGVSRRGWQSALHARASLL